MKKNNIILIGFMGVGKGTVARAMVKEVQEVGLASHFREDEKEEVCGNGTLVPYKNKAGTDVPVPNEGNKEAGMVGLASHFREDGKEEVGINSHFQYVIDTDDLIESMENRAIKKIFAVEGEAYFRNLEKKTARDCRDSFSGNSSP